jgi:hypothetical protein
LARLILDAPQSDASVAIASVEFVTKALPTMAILLELITKEKRLRKDLDDAIENATLALARDHLSSREMREVGAFATLIKREWLQQKGGKSQEETLLLSSLRS